MYYLFFFFRCAWNGCVSAGSTTFLASLNQHPNLYHRYTIEIVGESFVRGYLWFWGYCFAIVWPLAIIALVVYGCVIDEEYQANLTATTDVTWFAFGYAPLARCTTGTRVGLFVLLVAGTEALLWVLWVLLAEHVTYGWVFLVTAPVLLLVVANLSLLRRWISPYYGSLYRHDTLLAVLLRWMVEVAVITSVHALLPTTLHQRSIVHFVDAMAVALGSTLAVTAGRDLTWAIHLLLRVHGSWFWRAAVLVVLLLMAAVVTIHVSVFLMANIYLDTMALRHKPREVLVVAIATTLQLGCAGSIWASHRLKCWGDLKCKAS